MSESNHAPLLKQLNDLLTLYQNKQFLEAEKFAIVLTQKYPKHQFAWKVLGAVLSQTGRSEMAVEANQKALNLSPKDPEALNNLGNTLRDIGKLEEAVSSYNKAIALKPTHAEAYYNLGNALNDLGKLDEAVSSFKKAISFNVNYLHAYNNLGFLHKKLGKLNEAENYFRQAIAIKPDFVEGYCNLGNTLKDLGRYEEAETIYKKTIFLNCYKKALELKPDYTEAHNNLGNALLNQAKFEEAKLSFKQAIKLNPNYPEPHNNLGITLKTYGKLEEAEQCFIEAINIKPQYAAAHYNLTIINKNQDDQFEKMKEVHLDKSISEIDRYHINFALAKAYEDLQMFEKAFQHYLEGNASRKNYLGYNIDTDFELFEELREHSSILLENSLKFDELPNGIMPIFIVGMPRSGTTLVEQIISSHSLVSGAGELEFVNQFGGELARGSVTINTSSLIKFRDSYLKTLQNFARGNSFIIDKMPQNFRFIGLIAAAFPEAKIIHLKRDPAAVCWANFKMLFPKSGLGYCYSIKDVVTYHGLYKNLMDHWRNLLGKKIYDLDYELLVKNQESETRKVIEYLNLNWDEKCLSPHENKSNVATGSSVQVREKVYTGSSKQWLKYKPFLNGAFDNLL
jgi:tetratricopeptide (TPR) repeat protein